MSIASPDVRLFDVFDLPDEWLRILGRRQLATVGDVVARALAIEHFRIVAIGRRKPEPARMALAQVLWDASLFALRFSDCLRLHPVLAAHPAAAGILAAAFPESPEGGAA